MLEAPDDERRAGAVRLLHRLVAEHPDDRAEVAGAHRALARYYAEEGETERAIRHYRTTIEVQRGTNVFHGAELPLAETTAA